MGWGVGSKLHLLSFSLEASKSRELPLKFLVRCHGGAGPQGQRGGIMELRLKARLLDPSASCVLTLLCLSAGKFFLFTKT